MWRERSYFHGDIRNIPWWGVSCVACNYHYEEPHVGLAGSGLCQCSYQRLLQTSPLDEPVMVGPDNISV